MADNYILVPMHLDAMVLNQQARAATPFLRFQMDYGSLQTFESPETPFAGASTRQPAAGIYLHWTLPKALRHGQHQEDGSTDFHYVPNRWLVVRLQAGVQADRALKAWVLESDFLADPGAKTLGANPFIDPRGVNKQGTPNLKTLGRARRLTPDLKSLPGQPNPFLKAVGPGSVTFSTFSPGVQNVFAFTDEVKGDDDATQIDEGTFTYYVVGWYSDAAHDPLTRTNWQPNTDANLSGTFVNETFDWYVYAANPDLPKQTLVHALISNVSWNLNANNPPAVNYPTDVRNKVKVAIGNTAIDAMAAMVRLDKDNQTLADLLEAFQYGLLDTFDQPGSIEALNMEMRRHWFGASPGGTSWQVVAQESADDTARPDPPAPPLTPAQKNTLAALNAQQTELDRQQRLLASMQWNLFALWWKNMWQQYNEPKVDAAMQNWLAKQLPLQVGDGSTCQHPTGADPAQELWYHCKVKAQQNLIKVLTAQVEATRQQLESLLDASTQYLKALNMPQYYAPNDPVILITGLGRSTNFDSMDGLMCRLPSQAVSALTVSGKTFCADGSPGQDIRSQIPVLNDPNKLLPDGIQQFHTESFFLSPGLFAQDILGDAKQAAAVAAALKALPRPTAGGRFAPVVFSWEEWEQPWVPLLLDWEVTVLPAPAYTCAVGQPTCTFNQSNWQFNGSDFQWVGPMNATAGNFNEGTSQMVLQGRTFITPHLAFTLADQLDDYVKKHRLRDEDLEKLLEDLDKYIDGFKNQDMLSQRLSGLMSMLIQRDLSKNVPPSGDIAGALGDYQHGYPMPYPDAHSSSKPAVWDFAPLAGTFFVINKLSVIDTFGRTIDLMLANYNASPQTESGVAKDYFYPITSWNMKAPTTKDPVKGQGISSDATQRMIQLAPRLVRDSRLAFQLTSNDGQNKDIHLSADANPICGWVVPNHLDRSLALYAPDGTAWGELFLSRRAGNKYVPVWQPDPTNPHAPQNVADIPNPYIATLVQTLSNRADDGAGFYEFLQAIDETLWTINPLGQRKDQDLSVLIGRPLAFVRARLSLQLSGLPYYNQDWSHTFAVDPAKLPDASRPAPLGAFDGGISNYLWPVRLGSQTLRNDGLIGYYLDDPGTPANAFQVFNTVHLPDKAQTDYLKRIGQNNNYLQLRPIDDTVAAPDPKRQQVCGVTMLVDPRASIHAFTGLLPVVSLDVPSEFVKPALRTMSYLFRSGPFLTSPDEVRIPRPAERKGDWSWFDNTLGQPTTCAPADEQVRLPLTPPLIKEGWLKFTPNPAQNADD
jgi:hypothetical protein